MLAYTIRRLVYAVIAFLLLTYAVWLLTTREGIFALHHFSWDALLPTRYQLWLGRVLHGDLGYSIRVKAEVLPAMRDAVGVSLLLIVPAFILQEIMAISLGLLAGSRYRSITDRAISLFGFIGISTPNFWLALLFVEFFAVQLQILPPSGLVDFHVISTQFATPEYWAYFHANTIPALIELVKHLIMPIVVLAFTGIAADSQFVRLSLVEVLNQDYIRSARARGLRARTVLWKHAFRNTLVPLVTNIGLQLPRLVFAAMIIELLFSLPGVGRLFATAIYTPPASNLAATRLPKDYDVITAYFLILGILSLLSTIGTDLIYASADPRIRAGTEATPLVTNPLVSRHPLVRWGNVQVQVRGVAIGLTVLAVLGTGFAVGRQFITPSLPSIADTWSGSVSVPSGQDTLTPLIVNFTVDNDGKITGKGYDCISYGAAYPSTLSTYRILGDTDLHALVTTQWLPLVSPAQTYSSFTGKYPADNRTMALTGQVLDANGFGRPGSMLLQRGGDVGQFQKACK